MTSEARVPEVVSVDLAPICVVREIESLTATSAAFLANLTPSTATTYAGHLRSFFSFISEIDQGFADIRQLNRNHVIFFKQSLENRGLSNNLILTALSAVSSFNKFLAEAGFVDRDNCYGVKRPKPVNRMETADLTEEEVRQFFESFDPESFYYHSHRAIFAVAFFTGLRQGNLRSLRLANYGEVGGHRIIKVFIKGGKLLEIPLNPIAVRMLEEHIENLQRLGFKLHRNHVLFPSLKTRLNKPMCASSLREIFKLRLKKAGISLSELRRYSPHTTRTTFCGTLLNKHGVPAEKVQRLMGHASTDTTLGYDKREKSHDASPVYLIKF